MRQAELKRAAQYGGRNETQKQKDKKYGGKLESAAQKDGKFGSGKESQVQLDAQFGSGKETQAQLDALSDAQFGSGKETQAQLDAQFQSTDRVPFSREKTLSIIKRKKTIALGALYEALKKQHNRDKNEKRKFISYNTLRDKFTKRGGSYKKWVRDKVIVGDKHTDKNKTLTWK